MNMSRFRAYTLMTCMLLAVTAFGMTACKEKSENKTQSTETRITPEGTKIETTTTIERGVDEEGRSIEVIEKETTIDPEGLMNKETIEERYEEIRE